MFEEKEEEISEPATEVLVKAICCPVGKQDTIIGKKVCVEWHTNNFYKALIVDIKEPKPQQGNYCIFFFLFFYSID